jgi:two-component system, OmpR family, sensor histidine kinase KdpD
VVLEADELVLVDVTPEQLQERLKAGKIYANARIETALSSFFTEENLTHLRELALRQVADAVEEAPQPEEMLARGMKERIAVALEAKPESARLIRRGARVAQRLKAELHVVFVETRHVSAAEKRTLEGFEALTKELDGEFHTIPSKNVTDAIVSFTRTNDITQIIMGETHRSKWQELLGGNIIHDVMRRTHDVDVYVIADE